MKLKLPNGNETEIKVLGLTGGVASGKTTVGRIFAGQGIPVIDADGIAMRLRDRAGPVRDAVTRKFGTTDPRKLRELIFSQPEAKKNLENILHPAIASESAKEFATCAAKGNKVVVYEASLLFETGRHKDLDGLILVTSPESARKERLVSRDRISEGLAQKMIEVQSALDEEKKKAATHIIENSGTMAELTEKVKSVISKL
jgi:dephospho-CoA kinase